MMEPRENGWKSFGRRTVLWLAMLLCVRPGLAQDESVDSEQAGRDRLVVETLLRLEGYDLESNLKAKAAVGRLWLKMSGFGVKIKILI